MSFRQQALSALLAGLGALPESVRLALKRSGLDGISRGLFCALASGMGDGLHRIQAGPLKGQRLCLDPSRVRGYLLGVYEPLVAQAIQECCLPGATVCDIGAHYGYFSLLMAGCVGPSGICIAFEASSKNHARIRRTLEANRTSNLRLEHLALGDQEGPVHFAIHDDPLMGRISSLVPERDQDGFKSCEQVLGRTLDRALIDQGGPTVQFIKMDVEGAERAVVRGARKTLLRSRPRLLVEVHTFEPPEAHARPFVQELRDLGYEVLSLDDRRPVVLEAFNGGHVLAIPVGG